MQMVCDCFAMCIRRILLLYGNKIHSLSIFALYLKTDIFSHV